MKKLFAFFLMPFLAVAMVGCDSVEDDPPGTGDDPTAIYGTWVSAGSNVAPGLAALGIDNIQATFTAEGTYTVNSQFGEFPITQSGAYSTQGSTAGQIRTIELQQSQPTSLTARGIYEVDGNTMRYEVLDVSQGTPATAQGGFGSSVAGDDPPGTWTQVFVRQQ